MPKPTRREVLAGALLVASAPIVAAQQTKDDFSKYEKNLAKPIAEGTRSKMKAAAEYSAGVIKQRLEYKLPENSEPCTVYEVQK